MRFPGRLSIVFYELSTTNFPVFNFKRQYRYIGIQETPRESYCE